MTVCDTIFTLGDLGLPYSHNGHVPVPLAATYSATAGQPKVILICYSLSISTCPIYISSNHILQRTSNIHLGLLIKQAKSQGGHAQGQGDMSTACLLA